MTSRPPDAGHERLRLRISLLDTDPEIWRVLDVEGALRLDELHEAIQVAMGWRDVHLHEFTDRDPYPAARALPQVGRPERRWMPQSELAEARNGAAYAGLRHELVDEHDATVASVFDTFDGPLYYWYDFGDDWWHRIDLIEREAVDGPGASTPPWTRRVELVGGARRGPLEDSGGTHGYAELLETLADPASPEHADARAWVTETLWPEPAPEPFDPNTFDHAAADRELELRFEVASDVSGLRLGHDDDPVEADAPVVEVLERLPPAFRAALRARLRSAGAFEPVQIETDAAARMVRPYTWLLGRIGPDGLALTKAGWMPPAIVLEGMTELGWIDDWIGTGNREDLTWPIRSLRDAARRFGLVRVAKGRLLRTTAGGRLQDDPVALWRHLAASVVDRQRTDADRFAATLLAIEVACGTEGDLQRLGYAVANGLGALGWSRANGWRLEAGDGIELIRDSWHVLGDLGVFDAVGRRRRRGDRTPTPDGRAFARAMLGVR